MCAAQVVVNNHILTSSTGISQLLGTEVLRPQKPLDMTSFEGSKLKMKSFIEQRDGLGDINPHGSNSPPRSGVDSAATMAIRSIPSPLGRKKGKNNLDSMKISLSPFDVPKQPGNGTLNLPGTPQIKRSASQRQDGTADPLSGWESAPAKTEQEDEAGGLRERWEEQSNIQSLFSESAPTRPTSRQTGRDLDDDNQSTQSDVLGARPRPQRGRNGYKASESSKFVGRTRNKLQIPSRRSYIDVKDGKLSVPGHETEGFSASLITHAPRSSMPENSIFRQDPFETSSEETSPQRGLGAQFLHSSFPFHEGGLPKVPTHIERAAFHMDAVRKLSPEKYDAPMGAGYHPTYPKSGHEPSMQHPLASFYVPHEDHPMADLDANDSDIPSQVDELEQQQRTPKATKKNATVQDATVVLNPPKPAIGQKPRRTVVLQDTVLSGSPMARSSTDRAAQRKRRHSIDYDDAVLQQMSFAELQNEPFDHDPTREVAQSPSKPPADNLDTSLEFYRSKDENVQAQFFTQMSVRDWEDSGDWFLQQFGNIVNKMRDARQAKRKMVEGFEMEISSREEAVRRKKESIDRRLSKLKQDGDAMMKGKEVDE